MGTGRRPRNGRVANQPLGFESLTFCSHPANLLDFAAARVMLELFRGRRLVSRSPEHRSGLWLLRSVLSRSHDSRRGWPPFRGFCERVGIGLLSNDGAVHQAPDDRNEQGKSKTEEVRSRNSHHCKRRKDGPPVARFHQRGIFAAAIGSS